MTLELTVLGASGSYAAPASGPCSGYLVRAGPTAVWVDCGNGTLERLQRHVVAEDLDAVVITHRHPDHCVDVLSFEVLLHYYRGFASGPPVLAPAEVVEALSGLSPSIGEFFDWDMVTDGSERDIGDVTLRFSRTDHPPETLALEIGAGGKRLVYTSDTGPGWSAAVFGSRPDLLLAEATYQRGAEGDPVHLTAFQAGEMAAAVDARALMLTHVAPLLDPAASVAEAEEAFAGPVSLAAPDLRVRI